MEEYELKCTTNAVRSAGGSGSVAATKTFHCDTCLRSFRRPQARHCTTPMCDNSASRSRSSDETTNLGRQLLIQSATLWQRNIIQMGGFLSKFKVCVCVCVCVPTCMCPCLAYDCLTWFTLKYIKANCKVAITK